MDWQLDSSWNLIKEGYNCAGIKQSIVLIVKKIDNTVQISAAKEFLNSIAIVNIKSPIAKTWNEGVTKNQAAETNSNHSGKNDLSTTKIASLFSSIE